jgi:serine/threonine protein kinase
MFKSEDILQQNYQLKQQLGRTAVGHQTWLAIDLKSSERVILKLLAFSPQMQWEELKLFEREAQVLESLNHPRIPRYRDYFDIDKNLGGSVPWFVLVQDYIPGSSVQDLLEKGKRFTEQEVRFIAKEILEILVYLHQLNPPVLHRDIKPSNLILGEDDRIYLVDFGAVQAQAAVTGVTFTIVGTSGYAPLEQFWGRAVPASDLYALGATLIHLLTGIAPADLPQKDYRIHFSNKVNIKADLLSWIEKITDLAVEKRFSNAQEALDTLNSRKIQQVITPQKTGFRKIVQPAGTLIKLNKSNEKIDIFIPAGGAGRFGEFFSNVGCFGSIILTGLTSVFIITFLTSLLNKSFWALVTLSPFLLFFIALFVMPFALWFLEETHLSIDIKEFSMVRKAFKNSFGYVNCKNSDIYGVFVDNKGGNYRVSIRSVTGVYFLGGTLNEHESAWLAQEIREWLNLR